MHPRYYLFVTLGLLCATSCAGRRHKPPPPPVVSAKPPAWVKHIPHEKGFVCAVGAVDPTFYRQDGLESAAEQARAELAKSIHSHIWAYTEDVQSTNGSSFRNLVTSEVEAAVTDGVIAGAEVRSTWYDEYGAQSRAGMTYALACMSTSKTAEQLAQKLREAHEDTVDEKTIEAVEKRAQSLFDEMEEMEAKQAE